MARFEQYGRPNGLPGVQEQGGMEPHAALEVLNRPEGTQVIGKKEIQELKINPDVVDPDDVEMLEDMLLAAINEAMRKIDEDSEKELSAVTGGLNIPGL